MRIFAIAGSLLMLASLTFGSTIVLDLNTGGFGDEVSFTMTQVGVGTNISFDSHTPLTTALEDGTVTPGDLADNSSYQFTWELETGDYEFTIADTFGDGMNGGNYTLTVDGEPVRVSDGNFGSSELTEFTASSIPEPATMGLVALGLAGFAFLRRKRNVIT